MNDDEKTQEAAPRNELADIYRAQAESFRRQAQDMTENFGKVCEQRDRLQESNDINFHACRSLLEENRQLRRHIDALQQGHPWSPDEE